MFTLSEPCGLRAIRFLGVLEHQGWRLKQYGISYQGLRPRDSLLAEAQGIVAESMPMPAFTDSRYGVGYVGVHDGRGADFIFLDWWAHENELHHHVYVCEDKPSGVFKNVTGTSLTACVWDLRVMCFERQAWVDKVLRNPDGPDLDAYVAMQLNEDA